MELKKSTVSNRERAPREILLFIDSVDQVLNSNTVYLEFPMEENEGDVQQYIAELFHSGAFYRSFCDALEDHFVKEQSAIPNLEVHLARITFHEFRKILIDMLAVEKVYFHDSPYKVRLGEKTIQYVVNDFLEATVNNRSAEPWSSREREIEKEWKFYTMPRKYVNSEEWESKFLQNEAGQTYRPMSEVNNNNFLGKYFCNLGLDSFLVFHNHTRILFLLTNGGD